MDGDARAAVLFGEAGLLKSEVNGDAAAGSLFTGLRLFTIHYLPFTISAVLVTDWLHSLAPAFSRIE